MNFFTQALQFMSTLSHWYGPTGIATRIYEHLYYTGLALLISAVIAIPLGLFIGHTGRGKILITMANGLQSVPTLGVVTLAVLVLGLGLTSPMIALVLLGFPALLAGTYSGIVNVDRVVVQAARSLGMRTDQILFKVEIPHALPLMVGGLRNATLQVVSTATVASYIGLGGLGRYIFDGLALYDYGQVIVGSLLVTFLALILDGVLAMTVCRLQRVVGVP